MSDKIRSFIEGLGVFWTAFVVATIIVGAVGVFLAVGRLVGPLFGLPVALAAGYTAYWFLLKR